MAGRGGQRGLDRVWRGRANRDGEDRHHGEAPSPSSYRGEDPDHRNGGAKLWGRIVRAGVAAAPPRPRRMRIPVFRNVCDGWESKSMPQIGQDLNILGVRLQFTN